MTGHQYTLLAPAKVNLSLKIIGKRNDGYHELDTVMQKLDLCDMLRIVVLEEKGIRLECPGSGLSENESNLVFKAAAAFLDESGLAEKNGLAIILEKNIPVAAGLGGGSSDAGTLLRGLNTIFNNPLADSKLYAVGAALGADVPFFVFEGAAVKATGIGECLQECDSLTGCSVLLVNPGFAVSTAWAYENFSLTKVDRTSILSSSANDGDCSETGFPCLSNDLEDVTIRRYPEINTIKETMLLGGAAGALMSGSGPTVFGIFPDADAKLVDSCAAKMRLEYGDRVFVTRPWCGETHRDIL